MHRSPVRRIAPSCPQFLLLPNEKTLNTEAKSVGYDLRVQYPTKG
jgi:hypothetical protein